MNEKREQKGKKGQPQEALKTESEGRLEKLIEKQFEELMTTQSENEEQDTETMNDEVELLKRDK